QFLVNLHATFGFVFWKRISDSGNNREARIEIVWPIENHSVRVNQSNFTAVANKSNRVALGDFDAEPIRQDALHTGGFNPFNSLYLFAAFFQRNAQDAAITIRIKNIDKRFAADHVVSDEIDLLGLVKQNPFRVKREIRPEIGRDAE